MALTISGSGGGTALNVPKVETGTYTGTGTSGSSYPTSLTFSGKPIFVAIYGNSDTILLSCLLESESYTVSGYTRNSLDVMYSIFARISGNTVYWYVNSGSGTQKHALQCNSSGWTYNYIALTL